MQFCPGGQRGIGAPSPGDIAARFGLQTSWLAQSEYADDAWAILSGALFVIGSELAPAQAIPTDIRTARVTTRVFFITVSLVVSDPNHCQKCVPNEMASLSGTEDTTTGTGDGPSPTTATGPNDLIEVAPLTALREPAIIRAARAANINFFAFFTGKSPLLISI